MQAASEQYRTEQIKAHKERLNAAREQLKDRHEQAEAQRRATLQEIQRNYHASQRQAAALAEVQKDPRAVAAEQMVARLGAGLPQITDKMSPEEKARIAATWEALPVAVNTWLDQLSQARNEKQIQEAYKQLFAAAYSDWNPDLDKLLPAVDGVDAKYRFSPYGYLPTLIYANRERLAQAGIEQAPFEHVPGTTYATSTSSLPYNATPDSPAYSDPLGHYEGRLEANRTIARFEEQAKARVEQQKREAAAYAEQQKREAAAYAEQQKREAAAYAEQQKREEEAKAKLQQEVLENSKHEVQPPKPIVRPAGPLFPR